MRAPPAPTPPRYRPSTGTANRQLPHAPSAYASGYHRRPYPAIQTTGSALELPCLTNCPNCGDLNPHPRARPAAPSAPPTASQPSFFGQLTDALRDNLGWYYVADAADHVWTIAMATSSTSLLPHIPPLRHRGAGLNVAARLVLLALYLHQRDLHLPDPQLTAPQAAALTPEAWADTAPEEIAAYLRITSPRPADRNTLPTQRTPLLGTPPPTPRS